MRNEIEAALKASPAGYTEIRLEKRIATTVAYRGQDLEMASTVLDAGGIVRCLCHAGGWGVSTFNDRDDLAAMVDQAYQGAKLVHVDNPIQLAPTPVVEVCVTSSLDKDFRGLALEEKKSLIEEYNALALKYDDRIVDTNSVYRDGFTQTTFANSEGSYIEEERPMVTVFVQVSARSGDDVQSAWESLSGPRGFELVEGRHDLAQVAAQRSVALLSAESVQGLSLIHI